MAGDFYRRLGLVWSAFIFERIFKNIIRKLAVLWLCGFRVLGCRVQWEIILRHRRDSLVFIEKYPVFVYRRAEALIDRNLEASLQALEPQQSLEGSLLKSFGHDQ